MIFKRFRYDNLYLVDFNSNAAQLLTCLFTKSSMGWLWYRALVYVGMKQLDRLIKHYLVKGLKDVKFEKDRLCSSCQAGKQVGKTRLRKTMMSNVMSLELLQMDLFGSTTYVSIGGKQLCAYENIVITYP